MFKILLWFFIKLMFLTNSYSEITLNDVKVFGPGLRPDEIVMPARYFFINFNLKNNVYTTELNKILEININGKSTKGQCRFWVNKLDRKDGRFIIRYKNYETCYDLNINILVKGKHVSGSPFIFPGPIYTDQCNCPEKDVNTWLKQYGCTGSYNQIYKDLEVFQNVDMQVALPKIIKKYHSPDSTSFCHYIVKDNQVYRECYGKHVGFNMFADNILLSLCRKVVLSDMDLVINLGDWPLVPIGSEVLPIFSWCGSDETIDIVMPTYDITESTLENMGRVTLDMLSVQGNIEHGWSKREPRAFWRGRDSRTERLQLIDIGREHPSLFNVSLTNFFFFKQKEASYGPKQPHISFYKFFDYKYLINIDGTVAAYRLPYLLGGGGLVLKQNSPYYEHFYSELRSWEHYVPVLRNLSDLVQQVKWAHDHDEEAKTIADNAQNFANENLLPKDIICYHAILFTEWSKRLTSPIIVKSDMDHVPQPQHKCQCESNVNPNEKFNSKEEL